VANALSSVGTGALQETMHVLFVNQLLYVPYIYVFEHHALWRLEAGVATWLLALVLVDLAYYWMHRLGHEVNVFWSAHITHHNSEDYNLTTALRQGPLQYAFGWLFYLPLALAFPPAVYSLHQQFNRLYQFWLHTTLIGRMPAWFEAVFVSPSHHRVHHGRNARYIDKNYGGTFILFDKLFGTFEPETAEVVYGVTTNLTTWSPLHASVHYWGEMWAAARGLRGLRKLEVLLRSPRWVFDRLDKKDAAELRLRPRVRFDVAVARPLQLYCAAQMLFVIANLKLMAGWQYALAWPPLLALAAFNVWTLLSMGVGFCDASRHRPSLLLTAAVAQRMLDGAADAWRLEAARVAALAAVFSAFALAGAPLCPAPLLARCPAVLLRPTTAA
jgi:sterol desaturase/sphingolipid hydroxylase (fatty acid hydroxylase superfamily)